VTVIPGSPGSARLDEVPEPGTDLGSVLVKALAVGVCGTDVEIASGLYGWAPPARERLILGHESLGRVIDPGPSGFAVGDHVVGIVRRPDPVPCPNCAVGEWDMCSNGRYTERGIKQVDGFMADRWRIEPEYAVRVDRSLGVLGVLLEPTTVVVKALEHIAAIGRRTFWYPRTVLVTGAGPIGLLAALIGVQQGADVHVLDGATDGPKPALVEALGATYHTGSVNGGAVLAQPRRFMLGVALPEVGSYAARLGIVAVFLAAYSIPVTFRSVVAVTGANSVSNTVAVTPGSAGVTQALNVAVLSSVTSKQNATAYSVSQQLIVTAWDILLAILLVTWVFGWSGGKELVRQSYAAAQVKQRELKEQRQARRRSRPRRWPLRR
jgi:threonine dehydrogenase-like Zn-dependent dehydrogenase